MQDQVWLYAAAPVVAAFGVLLYWYLGPKAYGADDDWWETLRKTVLPQLNRFARRNGFGYAAYELSEEEVIGTYAGSPEEFETVLEDLGAERAGLLSAYKWSPDGRPEQGSWVFRHSWLSPWQVHVHTFALERPDGEVWATVTAHDEKNAKNPFTAVPHYLGVGYTELGEAGLTVQNLIKKGFDFAHTVAEHARSMRGHNG